MKRTLSFALATVLMFGFVASASAHHVGFVRNVGFVEPFRVSAFSFAFPSFSQVYTTASYTPVALQVQPPVATFAAPACQPQVQATVEQAPVQVAYTAPVNTVQLFQAAPVTVVQSTPVVQVVRVNRFAARRVVAVRRFGVARVAVVHDRAVRVVAVRRPVVVVRHGLFGRTVIRRGHRR